MKHNINGIYIMVSNACVFFKRFNINEFSDDMKDYLAGFYEVLSTLKILLRNDKVLTNFDEIEEITFTDSRAVFRRANGFVMIVILTKQATTYDLEIVSDIFNTFYELYYDKSNNWNRNITIFQPFEVIVDRILARYEIQ